MGNPITWEQEGGAYALVWLTFIGASIGLKQLRHVKNRFVCFKSINTVAKFVLCNWICSHIYGFLIILLLELTNIIPIEGRATTIALPIDVPRSWFFSVPLFITSILMLWTVSHYFISACYRVCVPQQQPLYRDIEFRRPVNKDWGAKFL